MPTVRDTRPWSYKPPLSVQLNFAHPYTYGLVAAWVCAEGAGTFPAELLGGTFTKFGSNPLLWGQGQYGPHLLFTSSNPGLQYTIPAVGPAMSIACRCYTTDITVSQMMIERQSVNATWAALLDFTAFAWRGGSGNNRYGFSLTGKVANNQWFDWAVADGGSAAAGVELTSTIKGYLNGSYIANTVSGAKTAAVSNTNLVNLGDYDGSGFKLIGGLDYIYIWNYKITDEIAVGIHNNPFQIFQPARGLWLFPSVGAAAAGWSGKLAGRGGGLVSGIAGRSGLAG